MSGRDKDLPSSQAPDGPLVRRPKQGARGSAAENAVRDELGELGYDVVRSAVSKGAADLWALHDNRIVFVQVKLGKRSGGFVMPSPAERRELLRMARRAYGGVAVAATRVPGDRWNPAVTSWRRLTGEGPRDWETWSPKLLAMRGEGS